MSRYRDMLNAWASQWIPGDCTVTSIQISLNGGAVINYEGDWTYGIVEPEAEEFYPNLAKLLTVLFHIEES